jgi:ribonuclease BN (tRNA processing enzyme)
MRIHVLGCSGAELPNNNLTGFLIDRTLLLDAGTIGEALPKSEQWKIRNILLSHPHLDHIKAIPFFVDNIVSNDREQQVTLYSDPKVIGALRRNLFNGMIWPDFTKIPSADNGILKLVEIPTEKPLEVDGYEVTAFKVNHTTPAIGYLIRNGKGKSLLYTGDTGPTEVIWRADINGPIDGLIVEVSFHNGLTERALQSGHLTPELLGQELAKIGNLPERIFITHSKPGQKDRIQEELDGLGLDNIEMLEDGQILILK